MAERSAAYHHDYDGRSDDARRSDPQGDGSVQGVQPCVDRGEFLGAVEAQPGRSGGALEVARWSKVGDWIWARLLRGDSAEQIKRRLSEHVDEVAARV